MKKPQNYLLLILTFCQFSNPCQLTASQVISDGSDGAFNPVYNETIDLNTAAPDGVFNFTTIHIPAGVTIRFTGNTTNTPVFFAATGSIVIEGIIDVSGRDYFGPAGPGGGAGGAGGIADSAGSDGLGPAGGRGGPQATVDLFHGNAGGGGGMATPGLIATNRTGKNPGLPGGAVGRTALSSGVSGGGGSGGGGGCGMVFFAVPINGGLGGGGGGGLQLSTPGNLTISGQIIANGGHGSTAYANGLNRFTGPGGGGSGGNIELYADALTISNTTVIQARGGAGGGLSFETVAFDPFFYSTGANGGKGFLRAWFNHLAIDSSATLDVDQVILQPWLGIRMEPTNATVVFWPTTAAGYALQDNLDLATTNWSNNTNLVSVVGTNNQVTITPPMGNRVFRLMHP